MKLYINVLLVIFLISAGAYSTVIYYIAYQDTSHYISGYGIYFKVWMQYWYFILILYGVSLIALGLYILNSYIKWKKAKK
jgi:hypothetical protein